jgi:hypothetical protein
MSENTSKKRKLSLPLVLAGGVSSLVLALGMSPTFSAFTASITNSTNTANAGTLIMSETGNGKTCLSTDGTGNSVALNTASCATINKYGGLSSMKPGDSITTTIVIANTGTVDAATFGLTPATCVSTGGGTGAGDLCKQLKVTMTQDSTAVISNVAPKDLVATGFTTVEAGKNTSIDITVSFPSTGSNVTDNTFQGTQASQPLTWTFQS